MKPYPNKIYTLAILMLGLLSCVATAADTRPNLLLIVTDDESWFEHDIYGQSNLHTPNFNRIAEQGILFNNAYVSGPSCGPSRAALLTGRNFWELEQGAFMLSYLPKKFRMFPALLEDEGYRVGFTGKCWGPGIFPLEGQPWMSGQGYYDVKIDDFENRRYLDQHDVPGNFAAFLDDCDADAPFVFWAGVSEPHAPWSNEEEGERLLKEEYGVTLEELFEHPSFRAENTHPAGFYYEILDADRQTGEMLDELEKRKLLENTIVIYIGDNGSCYISEGNNKGKASPYDAGSHVPMALMWQGTVPAGRVVDDFVNAIDIAPTMLEAAGMPVPDAISGNSFLDLMRSNQSGRIDPERDFVMAGNEWHTQPKTYRTIRDQRYAYIVKYPNAERPELIEELYDLENDLWQEQNLIHNPEYAAIKERLKAKMHSHGRETGDPRTTGELDLFNESLELQALLWPHYRDGGGKFRRQIMGKPYADLVEFLRTNAE
ncbi:MAG: sulfatase [Opitutae bacterium]|nr:sulfatase [Opitutae bacterium]